MEEGLREKYLKTKARATYKRLELKSFLKIESVNSLTQRAGWKVADLALVLKIALK